MGFIFHPAAYVVVSKLWIAEISVFSVLLTVFFIWLFLNGIRNEFQTCFPSHLYVSYTMTSSESQPSHRGLF